MKSFENFDFVTKKPDMGDLIDVDPEVEDILKEKQARKLELKFEIQDKQALGEDVTELEQESKEIQYFLED